MEIRYFKLIKTIVEEGSLVNSSKKLFLTQSALSHQLKVLENELGFNVFYRTRNDWELTEEGNELYKTSCTILENIERSFEKIKRISKGSSGTIRLSTECYSFYQSLPLFIQKMGVLYPQINVDLILEATHKPIKKLLSEEIDIALVSSKPKDENLTSIEIFEDEIFCILHKENVLNELAFVSAEHFKELHLIIHSFPLETVSVYEHFLKPKGVEPLKISAIPLTEVALEMVKANMGIMCMPKWALNSFQLPENIVFKKLGLDGLKRKHYIAIRKTDEHKKYISDFLLNFKEYFRK